jgi:hypothetical protein
LRRRASLKRQDRALGEIFRRQHAALRAEDIVGVGNSEPGFFECALPACRPAPRPRRIPGQSEYAGQKVPVQRPRARGQEGDVKIGSYELFRRDEEQQKRIWEAITHGLTTRGYGPTVRESEKAFAIEKSAVSEKFIAMSARKVNELLKRDLSKLRLCALLLDGVEVKQEHLVTALGIDEMGRKTILGFHQGARENQTACDGLFSDLAQPRPELPTTASESHR